MITAQLISTFVFAKQIEQSHFFLNPKFQASSHLLWPYSPVCVKPGQKPPKTGFLMSQFIYHCFLVMFFFLFHTRNLHSFMQEIYVNNKVPYLIIKLYEITPFLTKLKARSCTDQPCRGGRMAAGVGYRQGTGGSKGNRF